MICVIDTETCGLDPLTADIVELGMVMMPSMETYRSFVRPEMPIELPAMAVHHITEKMVADAPRWQSVALALLDAEVLVAHNASFDRGFIEKGGWLANKDWVCTWRCAKQIWPDAPFHSNQVLRYWLPEFDDEIRSTVIGDAIMEQPPHRALPDAWITAHILKRMLIEHSIEDLVEMTKLPILSKTCHFGKHRGVLWEKVPKGYLRWLISKDFDADTLFTAKHHLEKDNDEPNATAEPPLS